jgi:hypothetical protein
MAFVVDYGIFQNELPPEAPGAYVQTYDAGKPRIAATLNKCYPK